MSGCSRWVKFCFTFVSTRPGLGLGEGILATVLKRPLFLYTHTSLLRRRYAAHSVLARRLNSSWNLLPRHFSGVNSGTCKQTIQQALHTEILNFPLWLSSHSPHNDSCDCLWANAMKPYLPEDAFVLILARHHFIWDCSLEQYSRGNLRLYYILLYVSSTTTPLLPLLLRVIWVISKV